MKERFEGDNRPNLIDALKRQEFVGGENALAEAMAEQSQLLEFPKGHKIITQGGEDNDIYTWCHKTHVIDRRIIEVSGIALCTATVYGGALE